ncbi:MAG: DNA polymerase III subunit alpha [Candidatus Omnitrophica bacterium]|nr:DNA polymerase III subunit alpha [Candidatus Omnitrophota bacterium]
MKQANFVHLHSHTQYSLLDGASLLTELIGLAQAYKMPALAITDHGNMFGAIEFYQLCRKSGIKPIIGCEVYIAPDSRFDKTSHGIQEAAYHLILLAKDQEGYHNLMKLVSIGYQEGFYYKPRVDKEVLAKHSKGLICLTACLKGEIPHLLLSNQSEQAYKVAGQFIDIFGKEDFYIEMQDHNLSEQKQINPSLIKLAGDLGLGLVATNDFHYLQRAHASAHEALLCIGTQTTLDDPNHMRFSTEEFYFKTAEEMSSLFTDVPEAITNTIKIAERCNLELDLKSIHLPHFTPPEGKTREGFLKELVEEGLKKRYPKITTDIRERVDHELKIIEPSGFVSYFLIVWDFIKYAKDKGISVGPGRGSAAGSVVSYALDITDLDPLKYGLLFERFLNPDRVSLPDIDIDFCYERRDEVIEYVRQKYGADNVAQIITFGTMLAKAAIRDVARVMNFSYGDADRIAKLIPFDLNITLAQALEQEPELMQMYKSDDRVRRLIDTARVLEGVTRHASTHAAGVVISEKGLTNYLPLFKGSDDQMTTGYPMTSLEKIGLLKMDFLGLRTLTVIEQTLKIIKRTQGKDLNMSTLALGDEKTYKMLSNAESVGVFQIESRGMRDLLKKLKPSRFEDLIALLALYRPGPIGSGMVDDFIKRKHGHLKVRYDHPLLESILKDTHGIILYQEQVMQIANVLAGFSLSQADLLRRAISKKNPEVIQQQRKAFVDGCINNKVNKQIADKIFSLIEFFSNYGFNKSHSAAYALISYQTAWLKANFPVEFMAALLTSERENTDKVAQYIEESNRMGIKILPPDTNESFANFTVVKDAIRFGLTAVKNVGAGAIESIANARKEHGAFKSLYDFTEHVDLRLVNKKVIESLIKCGAMDSFKLHRSQMMAMLDHALDVAGVLQKDRMSGQYSLFDKFESDDKFKSHFQQVPDTKEWPEPQLLAFEKALLGFYISSHPLAHYEKSLRLYASSTTQTLGQLHDGDDVSIGGIISKARFTFTKKRGEKMAILRLEDLKGTVEVLVFPRNFKDAEKNIAEDAIVFIKGRANLREDTPKIIAEEILPLEDARQKYTQALSIELITTGLEKDTLARLLEIFSKHKGRTPVYLNFKTPEKKMIQMAAGNKVSVTPTDELIEEVEALIGEGSVNVWV